MNIPDKAVEAAARAQWEAMGEAWEDMYPTDQENWKRDARLALEAAAPFIAAQALRDHATAVVTHKVNAAPAFFEGMKFSALLAMDHASHIEEEQ